MNTTAKMQQAPRLTFPRFLWKTIKLGFLIAIVGVAVFVTLNWNAIHHCATLDLNTAYRSRLPVTMTDANGTTRTIEGEEWLSVHDVPQMLLTALVAAEDKRFWTREWGVDVRALLRAAASLVSGGKQGGSTLQMQAARSSFDLPGGSMDHSITRKVLEMIRASAKSHYRMAHWEATL